MAIQLPADIEAQVESGHFADAVEVVREAMRLLEEQERQLASLGE